MSVLSTAIVHKHIIYSFQAITPYVVPELAFQLTLSVIPRGKRAYHAEDTKCHRGVLFERLFPAPGFLQQFRNHTHTCNIQET